MMNIMITVLVATLAMITIGMLKFKLDLEEVANGEQQDEELIMANEESRPQDPQDPPCEVKLMLASFTMTKSDTNIEKWLIGELRSNDKNKADILTLSDTDKKDNSKTETSVRVNWNSRKLEYHRAFKESQKKNLRLMKIFTKLKSRLSEKSQHYTQFGRECLQSNLFNKAGSLIKVVDYGNMTIQQTKKPIKGSFVDMKNDIDCILTVMLDDDISVGSVNFESNIDGRNIKVTEYTVPYKGAVFDLDGNMLFAFYNKIMFTQNNIEKLQIRDSISKCLELICNNVADEIVNYFTNQISFKVKVPEGMNEEDVKIYVDGREVDLGGTRVLAFEHVVTASLDGCKTVQKIVNPESSKCVKFNLKAEKLRSIVEDELWD